MNEKYEGMSLAELESYGSQIQLEISSEMSNVLKQTKCIDLEQTGKCLSDLSVETNSITKKISLTEKLPAVKKVTKWLTRYDDVESRINSLEIGVEEEKVRLNTTLNSMYESLQFLRDKMKSLEECQTELTDIVEYFKSSETDDDGLKLQASVNRLKTITTTMAVVEQECVKTALIIKENKEVTAQLSDAADNIIPMFKVMMLNVIGAKINAEAMQLKKNLSKVANKIIVENAKQIEKTADDLIEGRTTSLIDAKSIQEANDTLQKAIEKVQKSAVIEVDVNQKSVAELQQSLDRIKAIEQKTIPLQNTESEDWG
jgi:uncharacterized protein YaaN involved in tellurite resistance